MKYMLLIYSAESNWNDADRNECMVESVKLCERLAAKGKLRAVSPLLPTATAATVRISSGKPLITDGPFAETTEQLGGFYLLELDDLDEAIAIATQVPPVSRGTVEIRPVYELDGLPPARPIPTGSMPPGLTPFMFLCYDDESAWDKAGQDAKRAAMAEAAALTRRLHTEGKYISASPLHPVASATSVRIRDGKRMITDGPFAETTEILGGYYLILAESRDEAVRIAAEHPGTLKGCVEVRPLFDIADLKKTDATW
ncbi:MAG: YciI family protein [Gemmataceae bacterium]